MTGWIFEYTKLKISWRLKCKNPIKSVPTQANCYCMGILINTTVFKLFVHMSLDQVKTLFNHHSENIYIYVWIGTKKEMKEKKFKAKYF